VLSNKENVVILSHRLRGFGKYESTIQSLKAAIDKNVEMVEFDTRHTIDNQIIIYHDPIIRKKLIFKTIKKNTFSTISKFVKDAHPDYEIATLDDFLKIISKQKYMKFTIDIKEADLLEKYYSLIKKYRLEKRVCITSWRPETLIEFHKINKNIRLNFSHVNFIGKPMLLIFLIRIFGYFLKIFNLFSQITHYLVFVDKKNFNIFKERNRGYIIIHILTKPPQWQLLKVLKQSRGGVGFLLSNLNKTNLKILKKMGLETRLFSIKSKKDFAIMEKFGYPEVVFSDNPDFVTKLLT